MGRNRVILRTRVIARAFANFDMGRYLVILVTRDITRNAARTIFSSIPSLGIMVRHFTQRCRGPLVIHQHSTALSDIAECHGVTTMHNAHGWSD